MGYLEDIRAKISQMKDRRCEEDFVRLADCLVKTGNLEMLPVLLNVINKYDSISRYNCGLQKRVENLSYRIESQKSRF